MKNKWIYLCNNIIILLCIFFSAWIFVTSIFYIGRNPTKMPTTSPAIILLGIICYLFFLVYCYRGLERVYNEKVEKIIYRGLIIFSFFGMIVVGLNTLSTHTTDLNHLHFEAIRMLETRRFTEILNYYSQYPHQRAITIILYWLFRASELLGYTNFRVVGTLFNASMMTLSFVLLGKILDILNYKKLKIILMIIIITNPIFYLYASYYYTDTLVFPFMTGIFYLYYRIHHAKHWKFYAFLLGGGVAFGFYIKSTMIVPLIAMITIMLIDKSSINLFSKLTVIFSGIVVTIIVWNFAFSYYGIGKADIDPNQKFPVENYIAMGLTDNGEYNSTDIRDMTSAATAMEKKAVCRGKIKNRIAEKGVAGVSAIFLKKIAATWSDGEMEYQQRTTPMKRYGVISEYTVGNKKIICQYACQIVHSMLMFSILVLSVVQLKRRTVDNMSVLLLSFFGMVLFFMIWHVGTRFSLHFRPMLLLMESFAIYQISDAMRITQIEICYANKKLRIGLHDIRKVFGIIVVIVTIILFVFCYNNYAKQVTTLNQNRVIQEAYNNNGTVNNFDRVEQTFQTDLDFNKISIKMVNTNHATKGNYAFLLLDCNKTVLYKKIIEVNEIEDDKWLEFNIPEMIIPNKEKQFSFVVEAVDEIVDGVKILGRDQFEDYYEFGSCIYDDMEKGDLAFRVQKQWNGTIFSVLEYTLIMLLCIGAEVFLFWNRRLWREDENVR